MHMYKDATLEQLKLDATNELDKMDKVFALSKNFSQIFDNYMKKLSILVTRLLDADTNENNICIIEQSSKAIKMPLKKDGYKESFKKRISTDDRDIMGDELRFSINTPSDRDPQVDNQIMFNTNLYSDKYHADEWKKDSSFVAKHNEVLEKNKMISALQLQSMTINKIIEAGEVKSRNLREILEKMFMGKQDTSKAEETNKKMLKLKSKVHKLRVELESKDQENQQLKINLNINESLKNEVEILRESFKKYNSNKVYVSKILTSSCKSCDVVKIDNSILLTQFHFTMKRIEILNQNVESLQSEFIELYKTMQDKLQPSNYYSNAKDYIIDVNESQTLFNHNGFQQSLDSNYNTIINKLETLEAGLLTQKQLFAKDITTTRPNDFSYNSYEGNKRCTETPLPNNTKLLDFKYSYVLMMI